MTAATRILAMLFFTLLCSEQAFAQNSVQVAAASAREAGALRALDRPARLNLTAETLEQALLRLGRSSGVSVAFSPSSLPAGRRVTCECEDATVRHALQRILAGTPFDFVEIAGQIVIFSRLVPTLEQATEVLAASNVGPILLAGSTPPIESRASALSPAPTLDVGTLQGRVTDATTGAPLGAVQISVDGTGVGGLSNAEGRFLLLNVPSGEQTVSATLIGYATQTVTVTVQDGQTSAVDFRLEGIALQMDEIVVTGTGMPTERRRLSADVQVLSSEEISMAPVSNVTELLQGRIAGATINAVGNQPGQAGLMSFRGPSSLVAAQTPVIYIDGVRVDNAMGTSNSQGGEQTSALADLVTADIERIEVTKGGAASTLYGADAAAGVIQIFTKRGGTGGNRVTMRMVQGFDQADTRFIRDVDEGYAGRYPHLLERDDWDPEWVKNNWYQTGHYQSYQVSALGGDADLGYNIGGRLEDSEGVQPQNGSTMYSANASARGRLAESLTFDVSGSLLRHTFFRHPMGTTTQGFLTLEEEGAVLNDSGTDNFEDAMEMFLRQELKENVDRFTWSSALNWRPASFVDARLTLGGDKRLNEQRHTQDVDYMVRPDEVGRIQIDSREFSGLTLDGRATFAYGGIPFFTSTSTTVGFQAFRERTAGFDVLSQDLGIPGTKLFQAAARVSSSESVTEIFNGGFFFLQQAGIADLLFLEAGVRFDGNTAFGSDISYLAYPKVGASLDLVGAGVTPDWMNVLRLRANYGATGKYPPPFLRDRTFTAEAFGAESAVRFANAGNADLKAERVSTYEIGLDASLWNDRISMSATAYRATTTDALLYEQLQPSSGLTSRLRNVGTIRNQGIEAEANFEMVRTASVRWNAGITMSTLDNEVMDLGGLPPFELGTHARREFGWVEEGYPLGVRHMGFPIDTNGDGLMDGVEKGIVRHPETGEVLTPYATSNGSIRTQFSLPGLGLSLTALGDWSRGSTVQDYSIIWTWLQGAPKVPFPKRYDLDGNEIGNYAYLDAMNTILVKGDYFKFREVGLSYEVPTRFANLLGGDRASMSLSVRNLHTFVPTPQSLFYPDVALRDQLSDPELHGYQEPSGDSALQLGGSQSVGASPPRQVRLSVDITF